MAERIVTARLVLRRFRLDDSPAMHRIMTDPAAMRFWSTLPHDSIEQTETWVRSEIESPSHLSDDFVVTLDGALIGKLGCWRLPEIGFIFDPAAWGRGFAYEALTAFIDRRRGLGSTELTADVDPRNAKSLRILQKAGFAETGRAARTWEIGGEWHDSIYLRLDLSRG
ncbi:MAG: GNAT family N-acetyltransferase [Sphingomicrobium sp.]